MPPHDLVTLNKPLARQTTKTGEEIHNIDCLIKILTGNKKSYRRPYPVVKPWVKPVKALKDMLKKIFNLEGSLLFCTYRFTDGMKILWK